MAGIKRNWWPEWSVIRTNRLRITNLRELEKDSGEDSSFVCDLCLEGYSPADTIIAEEDIPGDEEEFFASYHYNCFVDYLRSE